ncbi:MAG: ATP-binding protein, partial [Acidobacteriota bacterium]
VTGWLGDQKRREHERAERINAELQTAYADLRQTVGQLLQAERLSSLAEIASGVVHEIRNPLGAIKGAVEILEDELAKDSPRREFAEIAKTEVERIDKLVQEFFHFARAKEPNRQLTEVNQLIRAVKLLIENQAAVQNIEVSEDLVEPLPSVSVDAEQIKQVLLNLAINSVQAMPEGGKLVFRSFQKDDKLFVETEDTGGGIDETVKAKIFDPFFSTKDKGLGLGLSVVYKIVKQHDGQISLDNKERGTLATLIFPIS